MSAAVKWLGSLAIVSAFSFSGCAPFDGGAPVVTAPPHVVKAPFKPANPDAPRKDIHEVLALPDNQIDVAEAALLLTREVRPEVDIGATLRAVDALAAKIRQEVGEPAQFDEMVEDLIEAVLTGHNAGAYRDDRLEEFDLERLSRGEDGSCLGVSLLCLSVARRLDLPVYGVVAPSHFFLRCYYPGGTRRNIDVTRPTETPSDSFYARWRKIPAPAMREGLYLRALTDREVVAHLLASRSGCLALGGRHDLALRDADIALRNLARCPQALINRGYALERMGREAEAAEAYRLALKSDPCASKALNNLAYLLSRDEKSPIHNPLEARDLILEAIRVDPQDADFEATAGEVYATLREWRLAVRHMEKAVLLDPEKKRYQSRYYELRKVLREEVEAGREGPYKGFRLPPSPWTR